MEALESSLCDGRSSCRMVGLMVVMVVAAGALCLSPIGWSPAWAPIVIVV